MWCGLPLNPCTNLRLACSVPLLPPTPPPTPNLSHSFGHSLEKEPFLYFTIWPQGCLRPPLPGVPRPPFRPGVVCREFGSAARSFRKDVRQLPRGREKGESAGSEPEEGVFLGRWACQGLGHRVSWTEGPSESALAGRVGGRQTAAMGGQGGAPFSPPRQQLPACLVVPSESVQFCPCPCR